jgi:hypothetical protein
MEQPTHEEFEEIIEKDDVMEHILLLELLEGHEFRGPIAEAIAHHGGLRESILYCPPKHIVSTTYYLSVFPHGVQNNKYCTAPSEFSH